MMNFPGFVDLQVNGYRGVDFCETELTEEKIASVSKALLSRGVVAYCPTVVTSPMETYARNLPILARAGESSGGARVLGIHLEGPFINPADGPRGAHLKEHVLPPSIDAFERLREMARDQISLITLAPEMEGAIDLIKHIRRTSAVVVSLGHHAADAETIRRACDAGAAACTHVGNGLGDMIHRHLNPLWPMLAEDRLNCMFITDGHHVPADMLRVCLRTKGEGRLIVTSDVVHLFGLAPGEYEYHGLKVVLEKDGRLHRKGMYQLAGGASDMLECMNFLASLGELDGEGLVKVGYENPLRLLEAEVERAAPALRFDGSRFSVAGAAES